MTAVYRNATIYKDGILSVRNVTVREGMSGPVVRSIQQCLQKLKLYDEKIDGVFDASRTAPQRSKKESS